APHDFLGPALEQVAQGFLAVALWIAAVADVDLALELVARDRDAACVEDDHEVAGVEVRGVAGLVLALEDAGDPRRQPAKRLVGRVDDEPASVDLALACRIRLRVHRLSCSPISRPCGRPRTTRRRHSPRAGRAARPVPDGVAIVPVPRRVTRVEARRDPPEVADRDVPREDPVEGLDQLLCREFPAVGEGNHLPRGVDSGVGSAGSIDATPGPIAEAGQRLLELSLDRPGTWLDLEPGKVRSVVFDRCAIAPRRAVSGTFLIWLVVAQLRRLRRVRSGRAARRRPGAARRGRFG